MSFYSRLFDKSLIVKFSDKTIILYSEKTCHVQRETNKFDIN